MPQRVFGGRARAKNRLARQKLRSKNPTCTVFLAFIFAIGFACWVFSTYGLPTEQAVSGTFENSLASRHRRHKQNLRLGHVSHSKKRQRGGNIDNPGSHEVDASRHLKVVQSVTTDSVS